MYAKGQRKGTVKFSIKASAKAQKVQVAGEFSDWKPVAMNRRKDGSFVAEVPTPAKSFQYKYVVDDQWITDPDHANFAMNPFGSVNSVAHIE